MVEGRKAKGPAPCGPCLIPRNDDTGIGRGRGCSLSCGTPIARLQPSSYILQLCSCEEGTRPSALSVLGGSHVLLPRPGQAVAKPVAAWILAWVASVESVPHGVSLLYPSLARLSEFLLALHMLSHVVSGLSYCRPLD